MCVCVCVCVCVPVLDAVDGAVGTEDGVLDLVEDVRVHRLGRQVDLVAFGSLGLSRPAIESRR